MSSIFLLKLFLSFLIGGSWVILATYLADKLGAKIGGLIAGLPSTLLFGLIFLGWTQSPAAAVQATTIVPLVSGVNALFLVIFAALADVGLAVSLAAALIMWGVLAYIALAIHVGFAANLVIYVVMLCVAHVCMQHVLKVKTVKGKKVVYTPALVATRGVVSGLVIAFAVYVGKMGGPTLGGMFAMFPAMFITTMVISYLAHGARFAASLAKSALLSAASIVVFDIAVRYTYVPLGIITGTLISVVVAAVAGYLIYTFAVSKLD